MKNERMKFSLKELRARKNLSQEDLARLVNLTSRTIYNYEKDVTNLRNASYLNIKNIAHALDVEVEDIFLG